MCKSLSVYFIFLSLIVFKIYGTQKLGFPKNFVYLNRLHDRTFDRYLSKFDKSQFRIMCISSYVFQLFISFSFSDISFQKASRPSWLSRAIMTFCRKSWWQNCWKLPKLLCAEKRIISKLLKISIPNFNNAS